MIDISYILDEYDSINTNMIHRLLISECAKIRRVKRHLLNYTFIKYMKLMSCP